MKTLSRSRLLELLIYEPETGVFRWRVNRRPRGVAGAIAGNDNGVGYIKISIDGKRYYAHRLAFLYMTGEVPEEVDHVNNCRSDNRWANLRDCDHGSNIAAAPNIRGIRPRSGKWEVRHRGRSYGRFETKEAAERAFKAIQVADLGHDPDTTLPPAPLVLPRRVHHGRVFGDKTLSQWSEETGISYNTLYWRLVEQNWPLEKALQPA